MSMTIEDIKRISAETCGVTTGDIDGPGKTRKVALARQIAIFFTRKNMGVDKTGEKFNRNHSAISQTCKVVENYLDCDREYSEIIKSVEAKLV